MFRDIYKEQESCNPDTTDAEKILNGEIGGGGGIPRKNSDFDLFSRGNSKGFCFGKSNNFLNLAAADSLAAQSARKRLGS